METSQQELAKGAGSWGELPHNAVDGEEAEAGLGACACKNDNLPLQQVEIHIFDPGATALTNSYGDKALIDDSPFAGAFADIFPISLSKIPGRDADQSIVDYENAAGLFPSLDDDHDGERDGSAKDVEGGSDMSKEPPASMQSWSYLASSGDGISDYECGMLPGNDIDINGTDGWPTLNVTKVTTQYLDIVQVIGQYQTPKRYQVIGSPFAHGPPICSSYNGESSPYSPFAEEFDGAGAGPWAFSPQFIQHSREEYMGSDAPSSPPMPGCVMSEDATPRNSPIHFSRDTGLLAIGAHLSSKRRKTTPVSQPILLLRQQQPSQQEQQKTTPQRFLPIHHAQQVQDSLGYQYSLPPFLDYSPIPTMAQQSEHSIVPISAATAANSLPSATYLGFGALESGAKIPVPFPRPTHPMGNISWDQHTASKLIPSEPLIPGPPLRRRGGRPVPPEESDPRWNIWTVGNLEIRSKASGVGVKHLKEVLFKDDGRVGRVGCHRSKWTHQSLVAEVMRRRAQQVAMKRVVGSPPGFLPHQGWWFYIETS